MGELERVYGSESYSCSSTMLPFGENTKTGYS